MTFAEIRTIMRHHGGNLWIVLAALGAAAACGGVSHEDFYDGPAKRVTGTGGSAAGKGGASASNGGSTSAGAGGGKSSTGGASATGGRGNAAATGGSGNATAMGGTGDSTGLGGTMTGEAGTGDTGAGDAPGAGGTVSPGGMGGTVNPGGMGGSTSGDAGSGGSANAGGAGAGMGGQAGMAGGMGGRGGRGGRGGGDDCAMQLADIEAKLEAAQVCNRAMDLSCTGFVTDGCGCDVAVNSPTAAATKAYLQAVSDAADCIACTEQACPAPTGSYCQETNGGIEGRCVATDFRQF